jgi:hypothetical protein
MRSSGALNGSFQMNDPHSGHRIVTAIRPDCATFSRGCSLPCVSRRVSRFTTIDIACVLPVKRWQSLQWQL